MRMHDLVQQGRNRITRLMARNGQFRDCHPASSPERALRQVRARQVCSDRTFGKFTIDAAK